MVAISSPPPVAGRVAMFPVLLPHFPSACAKRLSSPAPWSRRLLPDSPALQVPAPVHFESITTLTPQLCPVKGSGCESRRRVADIGLLRNAVHRPQPPALVCQEAIVRRSASKGVAAAMQGWNRVPVSCSRRLEMSIKMARHRLHHGMTSLLSSPSHQQQNNQQPRLFFFFFFSSSFPLFSSVFVSSLLWLVHQTILIN
jgi:hypothetical protein